MVSIKFPIIQPVSPSRQATIEIEAKSHRVSSFISLSISKLFTLAFGSYILLTADELPYTDLIH